MTTNDKIQFLREEMAKYGFDACIVSYSDPHQSEYLAPCWQDRVWMSGFTGSAGVVIVTADHAGLWTDSRYYIQAEKELGGTEIQLHKIINQFAPEHLDWLYNHLNEGAKIAIDGRDFSILQWESINKMMAPKSITIEGNIDLVSIIWKDRPALPHSQVTIHELTYVSLSREEKIQHLKNQVQTFDADAMVITALDEIAYLLNIRGRDVDFNPVVVSYCYLDASALYFFVDRSKLADHVIAEFEEAGITFLPYAQIVEFLNKIHESTRVLVDPSTINAQIFQAVNGDVIRRDSPLKWSKAIKTKKEISHYADTMVKDAVAIAYSFKWLEENINQGVTEYALGEKIAAYRTEQSGYIGESFNAIVGYNENGAIVHYRALENDCKTIVAQGSLLVDCGGQYTGGTTDITRTIALSEPSIALKNHYTSVLKGHIALSQIIFPKGSSGSTLDILARQHLWLQGLNYQHGTGHGVGYFLNVHEGPHGFAAPTTERGRTSLEVGMIITNEPGFYLTDHYGIRIENVLAVKESKYDGFLEFETLTLYPYDIKMIDEKSLSAKEKAWINNYHMMVYDKVSPLLDDAMKDWFKYRCKMLG